MILYYNLLFLIFANFQSIDSCRTVVQVNMFYIFLIYQPNIFIFIFKFFPEDNDAKAIAIISGQYKNHSINGIVRFEQAVKFKKTLKLFIKM